MLIGQWFRLCNVEGAVRSSNRFGVSNSETSLTPEEKMTHRKFKIRFWTGIKTF